ncbi:MAG: hypothetical protein ACQEVA_08860 [Myxococcota bacterium]
MSDEKRETAEHPAVKPADGDQSARETGLLSHEDEARGYIAGFLELEYLDDLAAVLQAAEQITGRSWSVVVTSEGAQIKAVDSDDSDAEEEASADEQIDDEEIIELDDPVEPEAEQLDLDEDSFSDFEDAFADEDA